MLTEIKKAIRGEKGRTDGGTTVSRSGTEQRVPEADTAGTADADSEVAIEDTDSDIEMDQVFGILKNKRRRYVLKYLSTAEDVITLSELAEQIAAWECDKEVSQITSQERKRVYVGLYQCHLPKMADVRAISYNKQRGKIERGQHFELFERYLPREDGRDTETEESTITRYLSGLFT
jgi:hypothetical protein